MHGDCPNGKLDLSLHTVRASSGSMHWLLYNWDQQHVYLNLIPNGMLWWHCCKICSCRRVRTGLQDPVKATRGKSMVSGLRKRTNRH